MRALAAFLLAFPALFSIVNPIAIAFIFEVMVRDLTRAERVLIAARVAVYSTSIMLGALWFGAAILNFFGVSIEALRVAGGIVIIFTALELLLQPERKESRKQEQASDTDRAVTDRAFFPLTMPLTTGPGTISVAIALGAERPGPWADRLLFYGGVSVAAVLMGLVIWGVYWSADRLARLLSVSVQRIISRLSAFLLLCVGVQIMINGVGGVALVIDALLRHREGTP